MKLHFHFNKILPLEFQMQFFNLLAEFIVETKRRQTVISSEMKVVEEVCVCVCVCVCTKLHQLLPGWREASCEIASDWHRPHLSVVERKRKHKVRETKIR